MTCASRHPSSPAIRCDLPADHAGDHRRSSLGNHTGIVWPRDPAPDLREELARTRRCLAELDQALRDCDIGCPLCAANPEDDWRVTHTDECEIPVRLRQRPGALDYDDVPTATLDGVLVPDRATTCTVSPCAGPGCAHATCRYESCDVVEHYSAHEIDGHDYCSDCVDDAELRWRRRESAKCDALTAEREKLSAMLFRLAETLEEAKARQLLAATFVEPELSEARALLRDLGER